MAIRPTMWANTNTNSSKNNKKIKHRFFASLGLTLCAAYVQNCHVLRHITSGNSEFMLLEQAADTTSC